MLGDIILIAVFVALAVLLWGTRRSRRRGISTASEGTHNLFWLSNRGGRDNDTSSGASDGGGD